MTEPTSEPMTEPMAPCAWCAELIQPSAHICRYCGRPVLHGCTQIGQVGGRYVFGGIAVPSGERMPAVWDLSGKPDPIATWPEHEQERAWRTFLDWERLAAGQPASRGMSTANKSGVAGVVLLLAIFCGIYLYVHAHRYSHCYQNVSIFSWPDQCF